MSLLNSMARNLSLVCRFPLLQSEMNIDDLPVLCAISTCLIILILIQRLMSCQAEFNPEFIDITDAALYYLSHEIE